MLNYKIDKKNLVISDRYYSYYIFLTEVFFIAQYYNFSNKIFFFIFHLIQINVKNYSFIPISN